MNGSQIQSFITIAESQSFNQAEKELFVSRQALKKQMDALEQELGFNLFVRSHMGTALTPVGEEFYKGMKEITGRTDALINQCRELDKHAYTIRIGSPAQPRLILEKAFNEFASRYPHINQEIIFLDEPKTLAQVLDGTVDVAECIWTPATDNPKIGFTKMMDLPYKCLITPNHPLAGKASITLQDLNGYVIGIRRSSNSRILQRIKKECEGATLVETKGSVQEQRQIFNICYTQGVFLSRAYYANFMEPLVTIPLDIDISAESGIIYRKKPNSVVSSFIEVVKECFPEGQSTPC